jgi:hypothetical protein
MAYKVDRFRWSFILKIFSLKKLFKMIYFNELLAACKDDQIVIISPSVLYGMLRRKRNGQDGINECLEKIARQYTVYLNNDEDFVILLPASYNAKGLRELGFDESQVTAIEPESLMRFYEGKWAI